MSAASPHPNADVRMRGFAERISVEQALVWLDDKLESVGQLPSESTPLANVAGRVLAEDVTSKVNVPNFSRAMMDGYGVRAEDTHRASAESPIGLDVVGECFPGQSFDGEISAGQTVKIMTGAPLPEGVDAVLPFEDTFIQESKVHTFRGISSGKNFGTVGEDIRAGGIVLQTGRVLRPQDLGVLSSIGQKVISVVCRPRVRIVVTGDELLPAGSTPDGCKIVDANGPMLTALVGRDGGQANHPGVVPDDREAILAALTEEADVILASGGSSVGQEDHVPTLLAEHGELAVHGINMRPASPMGMGEINGRLVFLLPGNPVACLWGYDLLAGRAIRRLGGLSPDWPYRRIQAVMGCDLNSPAERVDYVRVHIAKGQITPVPASGASVLSSTTRADGFIVIPTNCQGYKAGTEVDVYLYD